MICFSTEYRIGEEKFSAWIWAYRREHAQNLAIVRKLRETVTNEWPPAVAIMHAGLPAHELLKLSVEKYHCVETRMSAVHATVFLVHLADLCGIYSARDAVADRGLLHGVVHSLMNGTPWMKYAEPCIAELERIGRAVPGYMPEGECHV